MPETPDFLREHRCPSRMLRRSAESPVLLGNLDKRTCWRFGNFPSHTGQQCAGKDSKQMQSHDCHEKFYKGLFQSLLSLNKKIENILQQFFLIHVKVNILQ